MNSMNLCTMYEKPIFDEFDSKFDIYCNKTILWKGEIFNTDHNKKLG